MLLDHPRCGVEVENWFVAADGRVLPVDLPVRFFKCRSQLIRLDPDIACLCAIVAAAY